MLTDASEHNELSASNDDVYAVDKELVRAVEAAIDEADRNALEGILDELHNADIADVIEFLTSDDRRQFVILLEDSFDAEILIELDEAVLEDVLSAMSPLAIANAIADMDTDDGVYVLGVLDEDHRDGVLRAVPAPDRAAVVEGLAFPEDSAGRLMQRELIAVPAYWTVGQVIDYCRETEDLPNDFYEIFVVDPRHRPIGQVALNRALRSKRPVLMREVMEEEINPIPVDMDQEEAAYLFQQYDMASAPVVDTDGRLVGVITFDDIADVIEEETEEDLMRLSGVSDESDLFQPVMRTTRNRFSWLLINLFTAILASFVIAQFDATIEEIVALAILMPIVASMGGNAGTQTLTVAVRALATRELTEANAFRVVQKEFLVGALNGGFFAVLIGLVAGFWFSNPALGGVIAVAMVINMLVAGLSGALIPLGLARVGADPAVSATVFLTTITDVIGFFAFLGLAAWLLL